MVWIPRNGKSTRLKQPWCVWLLEEQGSEVKDAKEKGAGFLRIM